MGCGLGPETFSRRAVLKGLLDWYVKWLMMMMMMMTTMKEEGGRRKEEGGRRKEECFIRGRGTQFFDVSCRYHRFLIIQRGLFGFEAECGGRALRGHGIGFSETNCSPDPRVFVSAMSDVL